MLSPERDNSCSGVVFVVSALRRSYLHEEGMKLNSKGSQRKGLVDGEEVEVREMC